jgi:hypothetical protein
MAADKGNELKAVVVTGMSSKKNVGQCNRARARMKGRATEGQIATINADVASFFTNCRLLGALFT